MRPKGAENETEAHFVTRRLDRRVYWSNTQPASNMDPPVKPSGDACLLGAELYVAHHPMRL